MNILDTDPVLYAPIDTHLVNEFVSHLSETVMTQHKPYSGLKMKKMLFKSHWEIRNHDFRSKLHNI